MHRLAIFDLDGTLAATADVDAACYLDAVRRQFGFVLDSDWSRYRHCTDEGIAREGVSTHLGRQPTDAELAELKKSFVALLEARLREAPHLFLATRGATALLARLAEDGWHVCIATGAWSASAELKRRAAGLPETIPIFSSDLAEAREDIILHAIREMKLRHGVPSYRRIVSIGDGRWDVAAAARLELPFLAIARHPQAARRRRAGAAAVVADFGDIPRVIEALLSVSVPASSGGEGVARHPRRAMKRTS
ncbi:MAG TPA: HAD family hydrolase [Thermoanaerobaculia bacterium]|nr:HAD family hydrolase [Thermoanaerobaculia bacterium]